MIKIKILILYVKFFEKYKNSFSVLHSIMEKSGLDVFYCVIDNSNTLRKIDSVSSNFFIIPGDNSSGEFSGWQYGIKFIKTLRKKFDTVLLINDSFLVHGKNFIQYKNFSAIIKEACGRNSIIGKIDRSIAGHMLDGLNVSSWIRTNAVFLSGDVFDKIESVIAIDDVRIKNFVHDSYKEENIFKKEIIKTGNFCLKCDVPFSEEDEEIYIVIRSDKYFIPPNTHLNNDRRKMSCILSAVSFGGNCLKGDSILTGTYPYGVYGDIWMSNEVRLHIEKSTAGSNILEICGIIDEKIFESVYHNKLSISVSISTPLFKKAAPLNKEMKKDIIVYLTQIWHSKFNINQSSWSLYRIKVKALLNEALFSANMARNGINIKGVDSIRDENTVKFFIKKLFLFFLKR